MMKKDISEDLKLCLAAMESYRTGSLTPILKEELKYRIQSRRMSEGKEEMVVKFNKANTQNQQLRPDEIEKLKRRKEQNKKAATKFRGKKKLYEKQLKETLEALTRRNRELHDKIKKLESEKKTLESIVMPLFQNGHMT